MDRPEFITEEDALAWFRGVIDRAGGQGKMAMRVGVSRQMINMMATGHRPIVGKAAKYAGLKRVNAYELTMVVASPEQERYENQRREWREQNAAFFEHVRKMELGEDAGEASSDHSTRTLRSE